jgi:hypothetical protein
LEFSNDALAIPLMTADAKLLEAQIDGNVAIFRSGDMYVAAIGPLNNRAGQLLKVLVKYGAIPHDSVVTSGSHYGDLVEGGDKVAYN